MNRMKKFFSLLLFTVVILQAIPVPRTSAKSYKVGDSIEFGSYPQSMVTDSGLIPKLGKAPKTWQSYGYYSGTFKPNKDYYKVLQGDCQPGDWMRYADFQYNGKKYRAVILDAYRPQYTVYEATPDPVYRLAQERNHFICGETYYFLWEPLKWKILDPSSGLVLCENIIDSQEYHRLMYLEGSNIWQDRSGSALANDYAKSSIRSWLNNDFYNSAFSTEEKALIAYTELDNGNIGFSVPPKKAAEPSDYDYASTTDKIFLLAFEDVVNKTYGFSSDPMECDPERCAVGTDYADSQGLSCPLDEEYRRWRLRTPNYENGYVPSSENVIGGYVNGGFADGVTSSGTADSYTYVFATICGIRPAFCFTEGVLDRPHVVYSSKDGTIDRYFKFHTEEELEDLAFDTSSSVYNPRLAHFLSIMMRAAYDRGLLKENYRELGFDVDNRSAYTDDSYDVDGLTAAFAIGKKGISGNRSVILISIRGSSGWSWLNNADIGFGAWTGSGRHNGFENNAEKIYESLSGMLDGKLTNCVFIMTGHSQGAAAANLLAVKLREKGVSASDIYDYNFACPNVESKMGFPDWNPGGIYDYIFNLGNTEDPVPYVPNASVPPGINPLASWGKYGRSYWFIPGESNHALDRKSPIGHDMLYYVSEMEKEKPLSDYLEFSEISTEYLMRVIGIHCPVDAVVCGSDGAVIAEIADNQPSYEKDGVFICVDGDEKWIFVPAALDCRVHLKATDNGRMGLEVYDLDIVKGAGSNRKNFASVALNDGKSMVCMIGKDTEIADVSLYVLDQDEKAIAEIREDGSEMSMEPTGLWQVGLRGDADLDGYVRAKDARLALRASAKLEVLDDPGFLNCDLNGDGFIRAGEARMILRFSAKLETAI